MALSVTELCKMERTNFENVFWHCKLQTWIFTYYSNRVIRQAVGSRFVQHDHQKDRIEEHCERPLKAVKSFSQWGAQLPGSVHPHFYEYLHITSNHVIRQAVGSRFVQHDHQKDRIEEQCERPLTLRWLMSYIYIYGAPILDVSRSHTTTQHSR